jgi:hypothetical protein
MVLIANAMKTRSLCAQDSWKFHCGRGNLDYTKRQRYNHLSVGLDNVDQSVSSGVREGDPSYFKTPLYSACDDDNSGQAKQEIRDVVHYCLHLLKKCRHNESGEKLCYVTFTDNAK